MCLENLVGRSEVVIAAYGSYALFMYVLIYVSMYVFLCMGEDCDGYWQCDVVSSGCFYPSSLFMVVDLAPCSGCRGTLPD